MAFFFYMDSIETIYKAYLQHPLVSTDTRNIIPGSIFFALKGDSFNGNRFAAEALERGAAFAVVDEAEVKKDNRYFLVKDVLGALQDLASYHRSQLKIPFIGITGSNGKTTSKELIHAVLSRKYKTCATKGNLNNHIGVPLTLLSITKEHEAAVIEMGANHVGEIAMLCGIAKPEYGIITNIGKAHLEGFGGFEGVKKAKSELYKHIKAHGGQLFVNADNPLLEELSGGIKRTTYGAGAGCDYKGKFMGSEPFVKMDFGAGEVQTRLVGKYNFENILAAACIGHHFGVSDQDIKAALEGYEPSNNRSQVMKKGSNTLLLDAYNANPTSMTAAIENFVAMGSANKVMVLGDMLELGKESAAEHNNIINLIKSKGFKGTVVLVGKLFSAAENTIGAKTFEDASQAFAWLKGNALSNSTVLVKGSRGIKLETVVEAF